MKLSIIDLGSQYTHVIWRTCRDLGVESVIQQPNASASEVDFFDAYILSGGPSSVSKLAPNQAHRLIQSTASGQSQKPVLGICFGHQLIAHLLGGEVARGPSAEYGVSEIIVDKPVSILEGMPPKFQAWVSHFDEVKRMPDGFEALAHSSTCPVEAMFHPKKPLYSVQFHPEVWHTQNGEKIIENFLKTIKS
ncbi:MAG: GMP synthase subunit A [Candidatus Micrarchaeota archaeon]